LQTSKEENRSKLKIEMEPLSLSVPRGIYPAAIDDNGNLKLPPDIREFLRGLSTSFVAFLEDNTIRIYPAAVRDGGAMGVSLETELDSGGTIRLGSLCRELSGERVYLSWRVDHLEVVREGEHRKRIQTAHADFTSDERLWKLGLR
jgi:hypothetical protein